MKTSNLAVREDYGPDSMDQAPPAEMELESPAAARRACLRRSFEYRAFEQRAITLGDDGLRLFRVR